MEQVSATHHLIRRNGVWYYRRRVSMPLVAMFGKKVIQFSLNTSSLKEAKKRRAAEDLKWTTQFDAAEKKNGDAVAANGSQSAEHPAPPLTDSEVIRLVQE